MPPLDVRRQYKDVDTNYTKKSETVKTEDRSQNSNEYPPPLKRTETKINVDAAIEDELKRGLHFEDEELLQEILDKYPELSRYRLDKEKQVQIIHKASLAENSKLIELIVAKGADINAQDAKGWTPLIVAAMNANYPVVSFLVQKGANISIESTDGTPLNPVIPLIHFNLGKLAREFAYEAYLELS